MTMLDEYTYLWDGTQPGWVLLQSNLELVDPVLLFPPGGPSLEMVAYVRKVLPEFADLSSAQVYAELKGKQRVPLERCSAERASALVELLGIQGISLDLFPIPSGYLPANRISGSALIIEDNDEARAVCAEALRRGVPALSVDDWTLSVERGG